MFYVSTILINAAEFQVNIILIWLHSILLCVELLLVVAP